MKIGTTIYNFEIELSDTRRGVYETCSFRAAQHPSENLEYLVTRVLAYCLEYREGIEFSHGLDDPDCPALWVHDLTKTLVAWIEVGAPSAERLHKAAKRAAEVAIYTYKDPEIVLAPLRGASIFRAGDIVLRSFQPEFLRAIIDVLQKRNSWALTVSEDHLYLTLSNTTIDGVVCTHEILS